jgi:hypothetical protein
MGVAIIGNVMNDYAKHQDEWHHELLHKILHGHKWKSGVFLKGRLYESWKDWLQHKPHDEAPKG